MKIVRVIILLLIAVNAYSQTERVHNIYTGILSDLYLNHQPYAKSEAMGRGLVANYEGSFGSYYNPALTSLNKGITTDISYTESDRTKPSISYLGVSYSNEKLGSVGVSAYYFSKPTVSSYYSEEHKISSYYDAAYAVNYSREIVKDLYAGVNFGVFHYSHLVYYFTGDSYYALDDGVTLDLGLLKKFNIKSANLDQSFQLGAALYNITNSKVSFARFNEKESLPVTFRIGGSHKLNIRNLDNINPVNILSAFTHLEYEKVFNSELNEVFKIGEEFTIAEIFFLRFGFYYSKIEKGYRYGAYTYPDIYQEEFTFGAGVNVPVSKILKFKKSLNLKIDYARNNPSTPYRFENETYEKYYTLGLSINYIP